MKKFIIKVNGNSYEVEVEEIKDQDQEGVTRPRTSQVSRPAPNKKAKETEKKEEKHVKVSKGQDLVKSPMPGNIWKIEVKEGQEVKAGDVLLILEAMKMENEILAPRDGLVSEIPVKEGDTVNTGDDLVVID